MKTIVHVNQHVIKANAKNGENNPPITVKTYKETRYCHRVKMGEVELIHDQAHPLSCGAKVWIEVDNKVVEILA